jgi:hypothetical protein
MHVDKYGCHTLWKDGKQVAMTMKATWLFFMKEANNLMASSMHFH